MKTISIVLFMLVAAVSCGNYENPLKKSAENASYNWAMAMGLPVVGTQCSEMSTYDNNIDQRYIDCSVSTKSTDESVKIIPLRCYVNQFNIVVGGCRVVGLAQ